MSELSPRLRAWLLENPDAPLHELLEPEFTLDPSIPPALVTCSHPSVDPRIGCFECAKENVRARHRHNEEMRNWGAELDAFRRRVKDEVESQPVVLKMLRRAALFVCCKDR